MVFSPDKRLGTELFDLYPLTGQMGSRRRAKGNKDAIGVALRNLRLASWPMS
jgi:hypothetical protein